MANDDQTSRERANVDPLVDQLAALLCPSGPGCQNCLTGAGRVVDHLTAAGRLLPEGGETRTEWGVRWHGMDVQPAAGRHAATRSSATFGNAIAVRRETRRWPDGRTFTGPWVEVTDAAQ